PQLEFAPAHGAEKGLSEAGQTIVLPLLVAREFHAFTFVFNGELEKPLHDPSRELASGFGFAFGRSFTRKVAAMIELRTESSIDFQRDRLVLVNAGIIDGVRNVVVYANIGHSVFSDDGGHFYAGGGFKVVIGRSRACYPRQPWAATSGSRSGGSARRLSSQPSRFSRSRSASRSRQPCIRSSMRCSCAASASTSPIASPSSSPRTADGC